MEGALYERTLMHLTIIAWIDGIFARGIVRVATSFLSSIAIPMFHHCVDTLLAPALSLGGGLECITIGASHIGSQLRILTKGATEARPTGIGSNIHLRRQGRSDTQGTIFFRGYLAKAINQLRIEACSQSE